MGLSSLVSSTCSHFHRDVSHCSELEASRTAADAQAVKHAQLEKQLEAALLDKKRLQDLDSGTFCTSDSHTCASFPLLRESTSHRRASVRQD